MTKEEIKQKIGELQQQLLQMPLYKKDGINPAFLRLRREIAKLEKERTREEARLLLEKENEAKARRVAQKIITVQVEKKVYQYKKDMSFVAVYNSVAEAARLNNCNERAISHCALGLSKSSAGFVWKYEKLKED